MKYLLLLTALLYFGCTDYNPRVVYKVEYYKKDQCTYYTQTTTSLAKYDNYTFIDTCGKFNIGDTLILTKKLKQ